MPLALARVTARPLGCFKLAPAGLLWFLGQFGLNDDLRGDLSLRQQINDGFGLRFGQSGSEHNACPVQTNCHKAVRLLSVHAATVIGTLG
jgi:hypothetical protein